MTHRFATRTTVILGLVPRTHRATSPNRSLWHPHAAAALVAPAERRVLGTRSRMTVVRAARSCPTHQVIA
jgi:hypothetical protein